jgi:hypothetical protein
MIGGQVVTLLTTDESATVSRDASTELVLSLGGGFSWLAVGLANVVGANGCGKDSHGEYELEILGSRIRFALEASTNTLVITTSHSEELPGFYAETWLVQPLRIMFGELIHPRLIARNLGDGRAYVFVTRSSELIRDAHWATLWDRDYLNQPRGVFWSRYAQLLCLIARERDKDGQRVVVPQDHVAL